MPAFPESKNLLVLLDFDRTIFDTARYYQDFLAMIGETYGAEFAANLDAAQKAEQYFDPFAYCLTQGVDYETVKTQLLAFQDRKYATNPEQRSYLFPDAVKLLDSLQEHADVTVGIITTGTPQSQEFKLSQCPKLKGIPREIISENKGQRLRRDLDQYSTVHFDGAAYIRFVLVDDREDVLDQLEPHPSHQLIHIVRPGSKYQPSGTRPDLFEVSALTDAINIIE